MLGLTAVVGVSSILWLKPSLITKVTDLFYFGHQYQQLSGDTVRMNLWRNGLLFLGETFGLGVGLGNIEVARRHKTNRIDYSSHIRMTVIIHN